MNRLNVDRTLHRNGFSLVKNKWDEFFLFQNKARINRYPSDRFLVGRKLHLESDFGYTKEKCFKTYNF